MRYPTQRPDRALDVRCVDLLVRDTRRHSMSHLGIGRLIAHPTANATATAAIEFATLTTSATMTATMTATTTVTTTVTVTTILPVADFAAEYVEKS